MNGADAESESDNTAPSRALQLVAKGRHGILSLRLPVMSMERRDL
jgi:hypothetical protein